MHRLVIVAGPNRGSSFTLVQGENSLGRQMDNHIVLSSVKVSKRHCSISINHEDVILQDESSTNGTFVNGTLVKNHVLKPGDRISVGDFVLELVKTQGVSLGVAPQVSSSASLLSHQGLLSLPQENTNPNLGEGRLAVEEPESPEKKIQFWFETKIMPSFYGMLLKTEYRVMVGFLMAISVLVGVMGSVFPIQDLAQESIRKEASIRSKIIAREIADRFLTAIANRAESQIDLSLMENEESIRVLAITNTSLQIIAPQSRVNQVLAGGPEAAFANKMARQFREGLERGAGMLAGDSLAIYVEPIKVTDPRNLKTSVTAMVVASVDFSGNLLRSGQFAIAIGIAFLVSGLAALIVYFIVLRLSFRPYEILNDDLDQVLRGELPRVTHEFKIEETAPLWNNINAAIQRIPRMDAGAEFSSDGGSVSVDWDMEIASVKAICEASGYGLLGIDQEGIVQSLNSQFEEISGIRISAMGQSVEQVARDQAFVSLLKDLKERILGSASRSATDEFEFSGVNYLVIGGGMGPVSTSGVVLVFKKKD